MTKRCEKYTGTESRKLRARIREHLTGKVTCWHLLEAMMEGKITRQQRLDLPANDGMIMFFDENDAVVAIFANVDPTDLVATLADFLEQSGASITVMKTKRPVVS